MKEGGSMKGRKELKELQALPSTAPASVPAHPRCPAAAKGCSARPREAEEGEVCGGVSVEGEPVGAPVGGQRGSPE